MSNELNSDFDSGYLSEDARGVIPGLQTPEIPEEGGNRGGSCGLSQGIDPEVKATLGHTFTHSVLLAQTNRIGRSQDSVSRESFGQPDSYQFSSSSIDAILHGNPPVPDMATTGAEPATIDGDGDGGGGGAAASVVRQMGVQGTRWATICALQWPDRERVQRPRLTTRRML